jgi:hypothetical protein
VSGGAFCATGTTTLTTTGAVRWNILSTPAGLVIDADTGALILQHRHLIHTLLLTALEQRHVTELLLRK